MAVTEPGEAHALDAFASELKPLTFPAGRIAGPATHWKDEGVLVLAPGTVVIVNGAGEGWEDRLNSFGGVGAVRLDDEHIAVRLLH